MKQIHNLKTHKPYFSQLLDGTKKFELRKNDRNFQVGDHLVLLEYDPMYEQYTQRVLFANVIGILSDCPAFGLMDGYVIMSIHILS